MDKQRDLLTKISSVAYLIVFLAICVSVGFSNDFLMLLNGIFFIIYFLSLWNTGNDTFDFYDKKYFTIDMLFVAVCANVPRIFLVDMTQVEFFCIYWVLFAITESICVVWDCVCYRISEIKVAKGFHKKWTLLTFIGIFMIASTVILVKTGFLIEYMLTANILNVTYQFALLLAWWISENNIKKKASKENCASR